MTAGTLAPASHLRSAVAILSRPEHLTEGKVAAALEHVREALAGISPDGSEEVLRLLGREPVHVAMVHEGGRKWLGEVTDFHRDQGTSELRYIVRHFNGDRWPYDPLAREVMVLQRDERQAREGR